MKTEDDVLSRVRGLARIYARNDVDGETIAFYAEVLLGRLTADEACQAISQWAASEPRWPSPGQLVELIKPSLKPKDAAGDLAQTLLTLIGRKGYTWESTYIYDSYLRIDEAIENQAGLAALAVVSRCGGWANFCREWGGEQGDGTTRAQLRGLCESAIVQASTTRIGLNGKSPEKPKEVVGDYISKTQALRARDEIADQFTGKMQEQLARVGNK